MSACAATGASTTRRPDDARLEARLRPLLTAGSTVAVAYSGGRDSTALLLAAARVAAGTGAALHALHVHHGLSRQADAWQVHCAAACAGLGVPLHIARVHVPQRSRDGLEAEARRQRYQALARLALDARCQAVLLAHHADDQAETLLLQALRGAGVAGLAAMPARIRRGGLDWIRPWLGERRALLAAYQRQAGVGHVEDDSNADPRHARNRLRLQVMPLLEGGFPGAVQALSHSAAQLQEALACLDELAAEDLGRLRGPDGMLDVPAWASLSPPRRSLALRAWLNEVLGAPAPRTLDARLQAQLRPGIAPHRWPAPGGFVAVYRDRLSWAPAGDGAPPARSMTVPGPGTFAVPGLAAVLEVQPATRGVPLSTLVGLAWRPRRGGEQFQTAARGVPRSLKKCFQAAGVPAWQRDAPLLYAGDKLLFVPALGIDARWLAADGEGLVSLRWRSAGAQAG